MKRYIIVSLSLIASLLSVEALASGAIPQQQNRPGQSPQSQKQMHQEQESSQDELIKYEEEVVSMKQIWDELEFSSEIWSDILDVEPKNMVVKKYVDWYQQQGVGITKATTHYVGIIDEMASQKHPIFQKPFDEANKIMLSVHHKGRGVCGIYPYDVAATKVMQINDYARKSEMPLKCVMEKN